VDRYAQSRFHALACEGLLQFPSKIALVSSHRGFLPNVSDPWSLARLDLNIPA
jgi:hypothetical protein